VLAWGRILLLAALLAGVLAACGSADEGGPKAAAPATADRAPQRSSASSVVVLVMENKERDAVLGSDQAPYLTGLARRYGEATSSYGVRHPSLPNYIALTSGSTRGISTNCTDCSLDAPNIADQLERRHISWKGYMEGLPGPCSADVATAGRYAKKHNPFVYFRSITGKPSACRKVVPATQLEADLFRGRLPTFSFITPDLCNDTHDCDIATGDRYLAGLVPRILRQLGPRGFLVLTYDEGASDRGCCGNSTGGQIVTVVAGPQVRRGARETRPVNHYGVLRTIEQALGLPLLGEARNPRNGSLRRLFKRPPRIVARAH
jgi:phosphatidylinositol-3-phosphatase